jgi:signal transduction histidine kinase
VLFLWQWRRRRDAAAHDEAFGAYLLRVVDVERRGAGLELADTLDLEALAALQREVLELKQEALERFAAGDLGDQAALSDLLTPLNAARDHVADLMLHVRGTLESRAKTEGRSAGALWAEAIDERPEGDET